MSVHKPNPHCVEKLFGLSERQSVVACEDIFDERGTKLWAKGVPVSRELQARLLQRRLRAPLETSLYAPHGATFGELIDGCLKMIGDEPLLDSIAGQRAAREILRDARQLHLPPPLALLLTATRDCDPDSFRRTQIVLAICAGLAAQLQATNGEAQLLLLAAGLHDLGEVYVNPEFLHPKRRLSPQEWKHVAAHPHVGQLLIRDLTSLPGSVGQCVGQHHERLDGSGYPGQLSRPQLHRLAGWIAVADAAAALIARGETTAERISLALKIVPEEFDREASDALIRLLYTQQKGFSEQWTPECIGQAQELLGLIQAAIERLESILARHVEEALRQVCEKALGLLGNFTKAMRASGITEARVLPREDIGDQQLLAEMHLINREVAWRMRNLARNIYLRIERWESSEPLQALHAVVDLLDHERPTAAGDGAPA